MGLVAVGGAIVAGVMPQDAIPLRAAAEGGVNGPDILDHRRVGGAGVLEIHRPLHRGIVEVLHADAPHAQAALGIGPGQRVLLALRVQLLRRALQLPLAQELRRGAPAVFEREGRLRRIRLARLADQRQVAQPQLPPVGQHDLCVRPVRLVAGDAVAAVAHFQGELAGPIQRHIDGNSRHAFAHERRAECLLAVDLHREDHAAPTAGGLLIAVHAGNGAERFARPGQAHHDLADGVAIQAAGIFLVHDLHGLAPPRR